MNSIPKGLKITTLQNISKVNDLTNRTFLTLQNASHNSNLLINFWFIEILKYLPVFQLKDICTKQNQYEAGLLRLSARFDM